MCIAYKSASLVALTLFISASCIASTLAGKVVGISDGDTITVLDQSNVQHKIRLAGIDAPEKSQPYGNRAKENLARLVFGKIVSVETSKTDRYGRLIGVVWFKARDVNLHQIESGLAWHYKAYEMEQSALERRAYSDAELKARNQRVGLWEDRSPVPPWEFRRAKKRNRS